MEKTENIKRSDLWTSIYHIVSQIPRKDVKGDAMDYNSAATEIEELFKQQIEKLQYELDSQSEASLLYTQEQQIKELKKDNEQFRQCPECGAAV